MTFASEASVAVNVLLIEPSSKSVSAVTGFPVSFELYTIGKDRGAVSGDDADREAGDGLRFHESRSLLVDEAPEGRLASVRGGGGLRGQDREKKGREEADRFQSHLVFRPCPAEDAAAGPLIIARTP